MTSQGGAGDGAVTPAEFLRNLDRTATPRPWGTKASIVWIEPQPGTERHATFEANGQCATVLRNLLPEIAAVVEAAEKIDRCNEELKQCENPNPDIYDDIQVALREQHEIITRLTAAIAREQSR